jgi:hypothetical protein
MDERARGGRRCRSVKLPSVHGPQVEDRKGDLLEYPKAVRALPFSDAGNTYFTNDNYNVNCSGDFPDNGGGKVCWG